MPCGIVNGTLTRTLEARSSITIVWELSQMIWRENVALYKTLDTERTNMGGIQQGMNNRVVERVKALSLPERRSGRNKMTETKIYVSCVRIVQRSDELRRLTFRDPLKLLRGS
jgi:hypothetical protein